MKQGAKIINLKMNGSNNIQAGGNVIITNKLPQVSNVVNPNYDVHISEAQCKQIKDKVDEIVEMCISEKNLDKSKIYPKIWVSLKDKFDVSSYRCIPKEHFDDVMIWLSKEIAYKYRPKLRKNNPDNWRKEQYKSIHARANQLGINIHDFAFSALELKKPISSLTELSDTRLNKLYAKLYSIKLK